MIFILFFPNDQNALMDGTVSTVASNAQDIVETVLPAIMWLVNVRKVVIKDGQGLSVKKVNYSNKKN